ncbi:integrase catalytic domain-containing protein [Trichonephila clavipes]|nr:integrase catalytic domain-containing protein [Trichonephila clavipes]
MHSFEPVLAFMGFRRLHLFLKVKSPLTRRNRTVPCCVEKSAKFSSATGNRSVAANISKGLKLFDDKFVSKVSFTEPDYLMNDDFFIQGFVKAEMKKKVTYKPSVQIRTTCQLSDIRDEYYEVVADDSDVEPLESEILDLEDDCEDIQKDKIDSPVKFFRLTTVTYGTKSAPHLATRSLKQLAIDDGDKYPLAAEVIMSDVYMDDLLTGADDLESGRKLQVQLISMLKGAGMELHKWSASNPLLLPDSMCQVKGLSYSSSTEIKTLGLLWKPRPDSFAFKISPMTSNCDNLIVTKKSVISTIARIFDPLGPVITRAKILLQSLWQLKLDWNDPLPSNLISYWESFIDALESINCLDIPRYCLQDESIRTELHGFSDSSEKAYSAALYLRCINTSGEISVRLLCFKSNPDKIQHCELWWFGPPFLHQYKELEPYDITAVEGDDLFLQELKETSDFPLCALLKNFEPLDIISNCSSFTKLQTVIAWCAEATLANIRNSFWIPSARNVVRKIFRICITCRKVSAKGSQQLMADLPAARVTACRVFSQVVKAIHLEIFRDLTTEAFFAALKQFVARRGRPIEIHSDNGRNFVGANNELRKILKALFKGKVEEIMDFLSKEQIKWNFNPLSAPHFGGLWEAGVISLKYHLKRVIGNSILSHEEFLTLVVQIEAVLNSRPICPLSNDPNDVETLTPAHFLVGSSLVAVPDPDYTEIPMNRLSRWQLVQRMNQHF